MHGKREDTEIMIPFRFVSWNYHHRQESQGTTVCTSDHHYPGHVENERQKMTTSALARPVVGIANRDRPGITYNSVGSGVEPEWK